MFLRSFPVSAIPRMEQPVFFIDYLSWIGIMEMKGSDRMRKTLISLCAVILVLCTLCSGCAAAMEKFENEEIRQTTETMLDALIANDFQAAYSLVKELCTEADFQPAFA